MSGELETARRRCADLAGRLQEAQAELSQAQASPTWQWAAAQAWYHGCPAVWRLAPCPALLILELTLLGCCMCQPAART